MKKMLCVLCVFLLFPALGHALELEEVKVREGEHQPFVKEMKYQTDLIGETVVNSDFFTGKLESITEPKGSSGSQYVVTVTSDSGIRMDFTFVPGLIIVMDFRHDVLKLKDLKSGDRVKIEFVPLKNGGNKVMSITREQTILQADPQAQPQSLPSAGG